MVLLVLLVQEIGHTQTDRPIFSGTLHPDIADIAARFLWVVISPYPVWVTASSIRL
jgi:hypothetical protein